MVASAEAVRFPAGASICVVEVVVPGEGFAEEGAILREGKSSVVGCDSPRLSGPAAAGAPCCWAACLVSSVCTMTHRSIPSHALLDMRSRLGEYIFQKTLYFLCDRDDTARALLERTLSHICNSP